MVSSALLRFSSEETASGSTLRFSVAAPGDETIGMVRTVGHFFTKNKS